MIRVGNAIFLLVAVALIAFAAKRTNAWVKKTVASIA